MKLIGLAGWSGAGKTTLLVKVIPILIARGISIATVKHAHHAFEIDVPGKDSFEQRRAGAGQVLVASSGRYALIKEHRGAQEPPLGDLLRKLDPCDLVIVEGFKAYVHPKVAVHRAANGKPPITDAARNIKALIADEPVAGWTGPIIALNDASGAADAFLAAAEPLEAVIAVLDARGPATRLPGH